MVGWPSALITAAVFDLLCYLICDDCWIIICSFSLLVSV